MIEARGITRTFPGRGGLLRRGPVRALRGVLPHHPRRRSGLTDRRIGVRQDHAGPDPCGLDDFGGGELVIGGQPMTGLRRLAAGALLPPDPDDPPGPDSALNPARTIDRILGDPLALRARQRGEPAAGSGGGAVSCLSWSASTLARCCRCTRTRLRGNAPACGHRPAPSLSILTCSWPTSPCP